MAMLNFAAGKITINYKENTSATDAARVDKSIVINLTGSCKFIKMTLILRRIAMQ
jgi:hypothetical protein